LKLHNLLFPEERRDVENVSLTISPVVAVWIVGREVCAAFCEWLATLELWVYIPYLPHHSGVILVKYIPIGRFLVGSKGYVPMGCIVKRPIQDLGKKYRLTWICTRVDEMPTNVVFLWFISRKPKADDW
jgi:hypothetical protein